MLINKTKPRLWQAKHILLCKHCIGSNRCQHYAMYCNVIGTTKRGNLKIEVFLENVLISKTKILEYVMSYLVKLDYMLIILRIDNV